MTTVVSGVKPSGIGAESCPICRMRLGSIAASMPLEGDQPVRVGVAGYGYWGPNLARNVATGALTELTVVCDPDLKRQEHAKELHPQVETTGSFEDLLADERVEAVAL